MLDVEDGHPGGEARVDGAVDDPGPHLGEGGAGSLGGRAAVEAVGLGPRPKLGDQIADGLGPAGDAVATGVPSSASASRSQRTRSWRPVG